MSRRMLIPTTTLTTKRHGISENILPLLIRAQAFPASNKVRGLHAHHRFPLFKPHARGGQASRYITFCFPSQLKIVYFLS